LQFIFVFLLFAKKFSLLFRHPRLATLHLVSFFHLSFFSLSSVFKGLIMETVNELIYTPKGERDYGTLACWGTNSIGKQMEPCLFQVVPAGMYQNTPRLPYPSLWGWRESLEGEFPAQKPFDSNAAARCEKLLR
jgi:hypothetical protein